MCGPEKAPECPKSASKCLKSVTSPDELTKGIGTRECHSFRKKIFNRITPISYDAAHKYLKINRELDYVHANRFLNKLDKQTRIADFNITCDIKEIREFAKQKSHECLVDTASMTERQAVAWCKAKLLKYGLELSEKASDIENIISARSEKFWFQNLKSIALQKYEQVRRSLYLINQSKNPYCSNDQVRHWEWEREQSEEFMAKHWFCSASGELISMLDAYKSNVSNPSIRRAELMVRIKGTEEYSNMLKHIGCLFTVTAPSKYHSHYKSGKPNPKYQGYCVRETHIYLNGQWKKVRAQLHRENIHVYGMRVVEPHHDGTPHWHLLLFMAPEHQARVTEIIKYYALEHDGTEAGAAKSRFDATPIDPKKGSAQDYIAKYVCKNIDGEFIDQDKYGNDAKTSAKRICAWASLFRIRQFQFIGSPSVSLWRELRKANESESDELEEIRKAADSSDWLTYLVLMGGHNIPRQDRPFAIEYKKQLKRHLEGLDASTLSELAFNKKPCSIRSTTNTYPIEDKSWTLLSSPPEQFNSSPAQRDGRAVDEASGGYRRAWGPSSLAGTGSNPEGLGLV